MEFKKKIAILGTSPGSLRECPWDDESWNLWGLSERPQDVKRWTHWFEFHNLERKRQKSHDYWERLRKMDKPLFVAQGHPELPHAILFPKDEICAHFGTYFTNTISWLTAFAMLQDPDVIGFWGVDMAQDSEYGRQRPSCEYFIGWAMGLAEARGRPRIIIPPESDLLKCRRLYGFDDAGDRMAAKVAQRNTELAQRLQVGQAQYEECIAAGNMISGAMRELQNLMSNGCGDPLKDILASRMDDLKSQMDAALVGRTQADRDVHVIRGAIENQKWVAQGF